MFEISEELEYHLDEPTRLRLAPALSGLCREIKETRQEPPLLLTTNLEELVSHFPVPDMNDIDAKFEKLLAAIRQRSEYFGQVVEFEIDRDYPLAYAKNGNEFMALIGQLEEMGLITIQDRHISGYSVMLSRKGWMRFSRMSENQESKQAFVAMWFDDSMRGSEDMITGAIQECGFTPMCIRTELFKETIMDKALGELRRSRFAIIDLTGNRGSVFFEAGFAKALEIEAIYVYDENRAEKDKLAFYVRHYQCHKYSTPEQLKEIVTNAIRSRIKS